MCQVSSLVFALTAMRKRFPVNSRDREKRLLGEESGGKVEIPSMLGSYLVLSIVHTNFLGLDRIVSINQEMYAMQNSYFGSRSLHPSFGFGQSYKMAKLVQKWYYTLT